MASDLTYKLSQLQVPPPPGVWKQLRSRLDAEYDVHEMQLAMKLDDVAILPPVSVWENIRTELQGASISRPARVISFPFRSIAVAAAFIGVIGFAVWYFIMFGGADNSSPSPVVTAAVGTTITTNKSNNPVAPNAATPGKPVTAKSNTSSGNPSNPSSITTSNPEIILASRPLPIRRNATAQRLVPGKRVNYAISPVLPDRPISIDAPPIRDEHGNIVMNVQLLKSTGDEHYIVVTSPNGQQTRISEKFLNVLQYLHPQEEDYIGPDIYQRHFWKERLHEWKNKLIHSSGFFPSNNNFLGIMDLKEIIQQDN